jgi:hypothetical protein
MMTEATTSPARRRGVTIAIWAATVLFMFTAAAYQRRTGPSYEFRGDYQVQGVEYEYALIRNHETTGEAVITLPAPTDGVEGSFFQRRYPTTDAYTETPLVASADGMLSGNLSVQPAAGKVEYYIVLQTPEGAVTIPESAPTDGIILRYKDPVPLPVLLSHVLLMAFSVLVGIRAGLGAAFSPSGIRRWVWVTLLGMSIGGMLLGPIVQKYAFGEYWTGFPNGYDLTDNKTLIMWLVWVVAALVVGRTRSETSLKSRAAVVGAALVMMVVYLIPHSYRGSQLDYEQLDRGVPASEAVETAGP